MLDIFCLTFVSFSCLFVAKNLKKLWKRKSFSKTSLNKIVGLAIQVRQELGFGFLEKVYENALLILLEEIGIEAKQQFPIKVAFHGKIVGD